MSYHRPPRRPKGVTAPCIIALGDTFRNALAWFLKLRTGKGACSIRSRFGTPQLHQRLPAVAGGHPREAQTKGIATINARAVTTAKRVVALSDLDRITPESSRACARACRDPPHRRPCRHRALPRRACALLPWGAPLRLLRGGAACFLGWGKVGGEDACEGGGCLKKWASEGVVVWKSKSWNFCSWDGIRTTPFVCFLRGCGQGDAGLFYLSRTCKYYIHGGR